LPGAINWLFALREIGLELLEAQILDVRIRGQSSLQFPL
jgi:hypothetical protein